MSTKFISNYALPQLCVDKGVQSSEGGAIAIIGVNTPVARFHRVHFILNCAIGSNSPFATASFGGALSISQASNISCNECVFKGNAALFGFGNDLISYSGESSKDNNIFFSNSTFSNLTDATLAVLLVKTVELSHELCITVKNVSNVASIIAAVENGVGSLKTSPHRRTTEEVEYLAHQQQRENVAKNKRIKNTQNIVDTESTGRKIGTSGLKYFNRTGLSALVSFFPSVVIANGVSAFVDPTFIGRYNIFFGDLVSIGISSPVLFSNGKHTVSTIYGNIQNDLVITVVEAELAMVAILKGMTVGQLNVFNSTLFISNNIIVRGESFLYNATIIGAGSSLLLNSSIFNHRHFKYNRSFASVKYPTIRFKSSVLAGLTVNSLISSSSSSTSNSKKATASRSGVNNISFVSKITLDACIVIVSKELLIDAPLSLPGSKIPIDLFVQTNVMFILLNKAIVNISKNAFVSVFTDTLFYAKNTSTSGIINYGNFGI